jgi:hypothetical protein
MDTIDSLSFLRDMLLECKATGPDGFEGLVADALASETGLVIRLAKSGSQFGRDASSGPAPFAIAVETKLYKESLRLEMLSGKVFQAGYFLGGQVDLWVLGATSEVGDDVVRHLAKMLDEFGIALLVLDWARRRLPPLAVLLTCARSATSKWFAQHRPAVDPTSLIAALDAVSADSQFAGQARQLRHSLSSAEIGLGALRQKNAEWLRQRFTDRAMSQRTFGQYITVSDPAAPALTRASTTQSLDSEVLRSSSEPAVVALLGAEGVGKTWLVARWIAVLSTPRFSYLCRAAGPIS